MDLKVDVLTLVVTTLVTGIIGWIVKTGMDFMREYRKESREWREAIEKKIDSINDATQANMRAQLVHLYEKYVTRGWLTPEEHAAWADMHDKYSALNANGLINAYRAKLDSLPEHEV